MEIMGLLKANALVATQFELTLPIVIVVYYQGNTALFGAGSRYAGLAAFPAMWSSGVSMYDDTSPAGPTDRSATWPPLYSLKTST